MLATNLYVAWAAILISVITIGINIYFLCSFRGLYRKVEERSRRG